MGEAGHKEKENEREGVEVFVLGTIERQD